MVQDQHFVHVDLIVFAVRDLLAEVVDHARGRRPAQNILVDIDADHLVGSEEPVLDPLLERIGIDRLAEVIDVRNLFRFRGVAVMPIWMAPEK